MRMPLIPVLLSSVALSSVAALPATAGEYNFCLAAADTVNCIIEQVEFTRQRNAEIDASIATVTRARAFEQARNAEIAASIAAVNAARTRQLEIEQNTLANRVLAVANAERNRRFAAYQNALASDSIVRVAAVRKWELAMSLTHCKSPRSRTPRCTAERAQKFARRQNALATASVDRVQAERERQFSAARNAEIEASIAAVARNRTAIAINTTHCNGFEVTPRCQAERNRELQLSMTHCKSATDSSPRCVIERDRAFHIARNAEINHSIAAVAGARALESAGNNATGNNDVLNSSISSYGSSSSPLETGTLGSTVLPMDPGPTPARDLKLQHNISTEPCGGAGAPFGPLHFANGLDIDAAMKPELDRLAAIAQTCPGVRIEIHGYSDGTGSAFTDRSMAQARAQAIADYLIAAGVAQNRLATIGRGALAAMLPYSKSVNRAYHRRVEFVIKDPGMDAAARRVMWDLAELLDPTYVPAVAGLSP